MFPPNAPRTPILSHVPPLCAIRVDRKVSDSEAHRLIEKMQRVCPDKRFVIPAPVTTIERLDLDEPPPGPHPEFNVREREGSLSCIVADPDEVIGDDQAYPPKFFAWAALVAWGLSSIPVVWWCLRW